MASVLPDTAGPWGRGAQLGGMRGGGAAGVSGGEQRLCAKQILGLLCAKSERPEQQARGKTVAEQRPAFPTTGRLGRTGNMVVTAARGVSLPCRLSCFGRSVWGTRVVDGSEAKRQAHRLIHLPGPCLHWEIGLGLCGMERGAFSES